MAPRTTSTSGSTQVRCYLHPHYGGAVEAYREQWGTSKQEVFLEAIAHFLAWHESGERGASWWPLAAPSDGYMLAAPVTLETKARVVELSEWYSVSYNAILSNAVVRWVVDAGLPLPEPDRTPPSTVHVVLPARVRAWVDEACDGPQARFETRTALLHLAVERWLAARVRLHDDALGYAYRASPKSQIDGHASTYMRTEPGHDVLVGAWAAQDLVDKRTVYFNALLDLFDHDVVGAL